MTAPDVPESVADAYQQAAETGAEVQDEDQGQRRGRGHGPGLFGPRPGG